MKNEKISGFIDFCKGNEKIAVIDGKRKVSFAKFLSDCLKMKTFLRKNVAEDKKALVFIYPYSYLFYVVMFGGFMAGTDLVIIDSFKDKNLVAEMIKSAGCDYVLVDKMTKFLTFVLPKTDKIYVEKFVGCDIIASDVKIGSVTTFTSGTTGTPKPVKRSVDFLFKQEEFIQKNIDIDFSEVVFCGLPMYSILSVYLGHTTIVSEKPDNRATTVITSIRKVLSMRVNKNVKKCFLGGAILYRDEAAKIAETFPEAEITYVYGATESALIYKTTLDKYLKKPFSFENKVDGVFVDIENGNAGGVGEIAVSGDTVIGEGKHFTGDLGKIENGVLYVYGRKKYSDLKNGVYNYLTDDEVRSDNKNIKAAFSFMYGGKIHVVYKGKITIENPDYVYHKVKKIPYDLKHKTKLDYTKAINLISRMEIR